MGDRHLRRGDQHRHVYELIDPLWVTNATLDRVTGVASTNKIVQRPALGSVAYEGVGILPNGVTYYGDELSASNGVPGGVVLPRRRPRRRPAERQLPADRDAQRPDRGVDRRLLRPDRNHFYVSVQHNKTGFGVVLDITGWR